MFDALPYRFDVWIAALSSGYTLLAEVVAWADARIVVEPHQPRWVLDLAMAADVEQATAILWHEWSRRSEDPSSSVPPLRQPTALEIGFMYLAHHAGRISLAELLAKAGRRADNAAGNDVPECEAFYLLLNELGGGGPIRASSVPLAQRVAELFAPMAAEAKRAAAHLPQRQP